MTGCGSPICVIAPREPFDPDAQITIWPCRCGESALRLAVSELRAELIDLRRRYDQREAQYHRRLEQRLERIRAACDED